MYKDKIIETENGIALLKNTLTTLKAKEQKAKTQKGIEKWLGYPFESSSMLTKEFALFDRQVKSYIKKLVKDEQEGFDVINWNREHFGFSGFLKNKNSGKYVYFSSSDLRFSPDAWYNNLLIRTAENDTDYTGGGNNYCKLPNLPTKALLLLNPF